jgi:hypothetical protein
MHCFTKLKSKGRARTQIAKQRKLRALHAFYKAMQFQVLNKGSMIALFEHINTLLCGGTMDLERKTFSVFQKGGFGRANNNTLQLLADMDFLIPVRSSLCFC